MQKLSIKGLALLKRLEGCILTSYRDFEGNWTIGYGSTRGVYEGQVIDQDEAEKLLMFDLRRFEKAVRAGYGRPIKQRKFDAMVLLAFNIGVTGWKNSTAKQWSMSGKPDYDVVHAIKMWNKIQDEHGNKVISKILVRRRNAESCVYYSGNYTKWV